MSSGEIRLSVVVPVFREAAYLVELTKRLVVVLESSHPGGYEIVFVDDGSRDGSLEVLRRLRGEHPVVRVVKLTRNFGQIPATVAGIRASRGAVIVTMDADLEHRPEDIPRLLQTLADGFEVAHGVRSHSERSRIRRLGSAAVQRLLNVVVDVPVDITPFRAMSRRAAEMALSYRESSRLLVPAIAWTGLPAAFVPVSSGSDESRTSGYSLLRLLSITFEMLISLSYLPLRLCAVLGTALAMLGLAVGTVTIAMWATGRIGVPGFTSILVAVTFLAGIQLVFLGVLGEYLARMYIAQKDRPAYHVDWND